WKFYVNRFLRIYSIYWASLAATLMAVLVYGPRGAGARGHAPGLEPSADLSVELASDWADSNTRWRGDFRFNPPVWSLDIELPVLPSRSIHFVHDDSPAAMVCGPAGGVRDGERVLVLPPSRSFEHRPLSFGVVSIFFAGMGFTCHLPCRGWRSGKRRSLSDFGHSCCSH